ncbi:MAG: hypothetical protein WD021_09275 [Rhodothermales bacterium]
MTDRDRYINSSTYVDTPKGIFTAAGVWFRTTESELEKYAGEVLEHESIERLIERSEVWLRSPQTFTVWLFPVFLAAIDPLPAALAALTVFVGWRSLGPSLVSRVLQRVLSVLDLVWLQGLYYVAVLSYMASAGRFVAVWAGLAGFILVRWGVVERVTELIVRLIWGTMYKMPVADHILRAFIIRAAMKYSVSLPQLDVLERRIVERFTKD